MCALKIGSLAPLVGLLLAGCGDSSSEYREVALKQPQFSQPVVLHVDRDGYAIAEALGSWSGVNGRHYAMPTHIEYDIYPLCINSLVRDLKNSLGELTHDARLGSYKFDGSAVAPGSPLYRTRSAVRGDIGNQQQGSNREDPTLFYWMINHGVLDTKQFDIAYSDIGGTAQDVSWYCTYVDDRFARAHSVEGVTDFHNGVDLVAGRRELVGWTYANTYETDFPGKGKVKVFAGTFTYTIKPLMPDLSFKEDGKASIKMFLDPDTGQWTIISFDIGDPSLTLQHADEPKTVFAKEEVEEIESLSSDIAVSFDGTVRVTEMITAQAAGKRIQHGIFRRLPASYRDVAGTDVNLTYRIENVTMDGHHVPFAAKQDGAVEMVKIGDPKALVEKGRHVYSLTYATHLPLSAEGGNYRLDWNATGADWAMPIRHAYANVRVPANAQITKSDAVIASGGAPTRRAISTSSPSSASFSSAAPLMPGQGFVISVEFSKVTDSPVQLPVLFQQLTKPNYRAAFSALFGSNPSQPWLGRGTASEGRVVSVAGAQYEYYVECMPHDCAENEDHVLFTRDGRQAWSLVTSGGDMRYYGNPSAEIGAFLQEQVCNDRKRWGGAC